MLKTKSLPIAFLEFTGLYLCLVAVFLIWGRMIVGGIYHGTSLPILNFLITHQGANSLDYYLHKCVMLLVAGYIIGAAALAAWVIPQKMSSMISAHYGRAVGLIFIGYGIYVLALFWTPEFFAQPVSQDDYIFRFVEGQRLAYGFLHHFSVPLYDPFINAGQLDFGIDQFWPALFFALFGWTGHPAVVFNIAILFAYVVPLVLAYFFARSMPLNPPGRVIFLLAIALQLTGGIDSREFYRSGCFGFVLSTYFALYLFSLLRRYLAENKIRSLAGATLWGGFALWVHPLTGMTFLALALPLLVTFWRQLTPQRIALLFAAAGIVIIFNLPWIAPFLRYAWMSPTFTAPNLQTWPGIFAYSLFKDRGFDFLCILFIVFVYRTIRTRSTFNLSIIISCLLLALIAFFGSQIGLAFAEPARYSIPLEVLITLSVAMIFQHEVARKNFVYIGALAMLFLALVSPPLRLRFGYSYAPAAGRIIDYVKHSMPQGGRLLVQESAGHPWFGSHFPVALPYFTGKEIIATTQYNVSIHYPHFIDNSMLGLPLASVGDSALQSYLRRSFVSHILVFSPEDRDAFNKRPWLRKTFSEGPFCIFEYGPGNTSRCFGSGAKARAAHVSLIITNAKSPSVVIGYHYYPFLKVTPPQVTIGPEMIADDPIPFIRAHNGSCEDFVIHQ